VQTNTHATLYKRSVVSRAESWAREEIKGPGNDYGVFWEDRKAVRGYMQSDDVIIFIPIDRGDFEIVGGDVLVKGISSEEITATFTITDLEKAYRDVVKVNSVDTMDYGSEHMQHVRIGAS